MRLLPTILSGAAVAAVLASGAAAQKAVLVRAGKAWLSPERTLSHASILLQGGKVTDMAARKSATERSALQGRADVVLDYEGAVLTAGFVDVHSHIGATGELTESVESFTPELRAAPAYDPYAPGWKELVRRGVTTALLSPDDRNLMGGLAAFLKPGRPLPAGDVDSYLKMSFTTQSLNRERRPTSLLGAGDYLRESFGSLEGLKPEDLSPAQRAIAGILGGGRRVGIACRTPREVFAALDTVETYQLSAFLIGVTEGEKCLSRIKGADLPVVLAPLGLDSSRKALRLPQTLVRQGIPFAFAGETDTKTGTPRLQLTLSLAVESGLGTKDALAAVTTVPAQIAGLSERVGTLFQGRDADLLVWSGEPWDLRSKLLAVVQNGEVVHRLETPKSTR